MEALVSDGFFPWSFHFKVCLSINSFRELFSHQNEKEIDNPVSLISLFGITIG
jgi:hypothetical protein